MILVRWETTPDDIHGLIAGAQGVLTAHGGMTSHAAVVARGMGKPCVAGCEALTVDLDGADDTIGGHDARRGRRDHDRRRHRRGDHRRGRRSSRRRSTSDFETILGWADELRRLRVRANADTPEDAAKAREFGAEGIGLCRTEHMFMAEDRLPLVREMIMAVDEDERRAALDAAASAPAVGLRGDLRGDGGPAGDDPAARPAAARVPAAARGGRDARDGARGSARSREANPMLGTRGCRLGLLYPGDLRDAGARDRPRRARGGGATGGAPLVEIMHPLVGFAEELRRLRELTLDTASAELEQARARSSTSSAR